MGTRSLTKVIDEDGNVLVNMYRQYDGYPSGHGLELANFLYGTVIVNGLGMERPKKLANGAGCLAAQMVAHFKTEPGGIYLMPIDSNSCCQDYEYKVQVRADLSVAVTVLDCSDNATTYCGDVEKFHQFCEKEE
jgi:hypothetical protein